MRKKEQKRSTVKKVVIHIEGGLGNQMFQYAFGRKLEIKNNIELFYDISHYNDLISLITKRCYQLSEFNCNIKIANKSILRKWNCLYISPKSRTFKREIIMRLWEKFKRNFFSRIFKYKYFTGERLLFNKETLNVKYNMYYSGNWETEKYFADIRSILLREFIPREPLSDEAIHYKELIENCNSVAVHFRRGDKVETEDAHGCGVCDLNYYYNAVRYILDKVENPKFFIFSDDIRWVKRNWDMTVENVMINIRLGEIEELMLMKFCKHNIIANSTFSWWGAWLGENEGKVVITPKQYFKSGMKTEIFEVDGWIKMDNMLLNK